MYLKFRNPQQELVKNLAAILPTSTPAPCTHRTTTAVACDRLPLSAFWVGDVRRMFSLLPSSHETNTGEHTAVYLALPLTVHLVTLPAQHTESFISLFLSTVFSWVQLALLVLLEYLPAPATCRLL